LSNIFGTSTFFSKLLYTLLLLRLAHFQAEWLP